jgi:CheY-like chemotaxis protein
VLVHVGGDDAQVRIEVTDSGIGIAPEFLPHVFDRFRQADGSTTRRFGGLGLGLSIVRHLAEMHGGKVVARSAGPEQGASFEVTLPSHAMALLRAGDTTVRQAHGDIDLQGLSVLVVDDEPDVLELLSRVLGDARAQVMAVRNADAALDAIPRWKPRLLISDIGMPGMDGYELIRRVRRTPAAPRVPAIALTAFARSEDRKRALDSGFDVYLSKPVEPHELLAQVHRLAEEHRARQ